MNARSDYITVVEQRESDIFVRIKSNSQAIILIKTASVFSHYRFLLISRGCIWFIDWQDRGMPVCEN